MLKRVQLIIHGRVQGVFFRQKTKQQAKRLGLAGWVRNESDGTVKIIAQGEESDLQELIVWCKMKKDNDPALVEKVEIFWQNYGEGFDRFQILK